MQPPTPEDFLTRSMQAARDAGSVHFEVDLTLGRKVEGRGDDEVHFHVEGNRSDAGLDARGIVGSTAFGLVQADGVLYLQAGGTWYRAPFTFSSLFQDETFSDAIPEAACIDGGSEGCTRVDFGPPLANGQLGRLFKGDLEHREGTWVLEGTLDSAAFTDLMGRLYPELYEPYETAGEARWVAGDDLLPEEIVYSYTLDRDAIARHLQEHQAPEGVLEERLDLRLRFSRWGRDFTPHAPASARPFTQELERALFDRGLRSIFAYI